MIRTGVNRNYPIDEYRNVKPGDRLLVKSRQWYEDNKCGNLDCVPLDYCSFSPTMVDFCGKIVTVSNVEEVLTPDNEWTVRKFTIKEDSETHRWTQEMFECIVTDRSLTETR